MMDEVSAINQIEGIAIITTLGIGGLVIAVSIRIEYSLLVFTISNYQIF